MRVLVNYMLRKDTWFVQAITEDAKTPISPILEVPDQVTLIRLLRYLGAGEAEINGVNAKIGRWSCGSTWIELEPGRRNLLGHPAALERAGRPDGMKRPLITAAGL
jgi:hypothetical protein